MRTVALVACLIGLHVSAVSCKAPVPGQSVAIATPAAAIAAAKVAWKSIYDKAPWHSAFSPESVAHGEPYVATLDNGLWRVVGTLPRGSIGGTSEAAVCQSDGSVEATSHGQ
jgi:hypothetical protein